MLERVKAGIIRGILSASVNSGTYLEIEKIKGKISNEEKSIETSIVELGQLVYEKWTIEQLDISELEERCRSIAEKQKNILAFQEEIQRLEVEKNRILGKENSTNSAVSTIPCAKCGTQNPASGKFCLQCGAELKAEAIADENTVLCSCGNKCKVTDKFCMKCGKVIQKEEE